MGVLLLRETKFFPLHVHVHDDWQLNFDLQVSEPQKSVLGG